MLNIAHYCYYSAPLPPNWSQSEANGDVYFYHIDTGVTTWTHPIDSLLRYFVVELFGRSPIDTANGVVQYVESQTCDACDVLWSSRALIKIIELYDPIIHRQVVTRTRPLLSSLQSCNGAKGSSNQEGVHSAAVPTESGPSIACESRRPTRDPGECDPHPGTCVSWRTTSAHQRTIDPHDFTFSAGQLVHAIENAHGPTESSNSVALSMAGTAWLRG